MSITFLGRFLAIISLRFCELLLIAMQERIESVRTALQPLRLTLGQQEFVGGDQPIYADYAIASVILFSRTVSTIQVGAKHHTNGLHRQSVSAGLKVWIKKHICIMARVPYFPCRKTHNDQSPHYKCDALVRLDNGLA